MVSRQPRRNAIVLHEDDELSSLVVLLNQNDLRGYHAPDLRPSFKLPMLEVLRPQPHSLLSPASKPHPNKPAPGGQLDTMKPLTSSEKLDLGGSANCERPLDKNCRKVHFAKRKFVRVYRPVRDASLWWSSEELLASRDEELRTIDRMKSVSDFLHLYRTARRQVRDENFLSEDDFHNIIQGMALGLHGLETSRDSNRRAKETTKITASVVSLYQEQAAMGCTAKQLTRITRAHAVARSAGDRRWATTLGHAGRRAVFVDG